MKNGNLLIALVIGGVIGFVVGKATTAPAPASAVAVAGNDTAKPSKGGDQGGEPANAIYNVPIGSAQVKGSDTAKVTIVEFSDFECPFCARAFETVNKIEQAYGKDVRVAFKENPLPFHQHAMPAAEASLAAAEQGKFWEMHDKMFSNREHLERADLEKYATEIGLDLTKFKAALDSHKFADAIKRDQAEAVNFQASGTPHFFINGHRLVGAQPYESFKALIDTEIRKADALVAAGASPKDLYVKEVGAGLTRAAAPKPQNPAQQGPGGATPVKDVDTGDMLRGPKDAKVTIVEFSDFQCPFCGRVWPTVEKILKEYPKDVRFYFREEPLPFHPNAMPAAIAATAAGKQGKFWEFYDLAFQHQTELSPAKYEEWGKQIHLNMDKFKKDIEDPATKAIVQADSDYGRKVGANGTPTFFINGREVAGAMPFESFKSIIDEELKKADNMKGATQPELYKKLVAFNLANAPKAAAVAGDDGKPVKIDNGSSPVRGPASAPVTIVEFSDFQCPFCGRVEPTISGLMDKYKGKLKIVWKNQPLPFHPNARPAAKAALAAAEQGKFWEMHDKLFANQQQLSPENYVNWAKDLHLNVDKFKADMESTKYDAILDSDSKLGGSVGANGTPTFFVNGHKIVGAQPAENFEKMIDDALAAK